MSRDRQQTPTQIRVASIWAQDRTGIIGDGQGMLWHVPADFQHFKQETMGAPVLMGRASFEALGKPLPGRPNIVLTRDPGYIPEDVTVVSSISAAVQAGYEAAREIGARTIWVTGGANIYRQTMDIVDELVITDLDLSVEDPGGALLRAPRINPEVWTIDHERSDQQWRAISGDSRWRVTTYVRAGIPGASGTAAPTELGTA